MSIASRVKYDASPAEYNMVTPGTAVYSTPSARAAEAASVQYGTYSYAKNPSQSPVVEAARAASGSGFSKGDQAYYATWGQGGGAVANPAASSNLDPYPFADISKLYNTDAKTAYQEALANTAIQRQMDDFKRAGLNPALAARYGGADGVGLVGNVAGVGAGYANTSGATEGGGSSFSSPGSTSGRGSSAAGISSVLNYASKNYNVQSAIASLASAATFGITKSFQGSAAVYYGVKGAFGVLNSLRR